MNVPTGACSKLVEGPVVERGALAEKFHNQPNLPRKRERDYNALASQKKKKVCKAYY